MATVHIGAEVEEITETVIMPGDPLRAKFIAETFLDQWRMVSSIRNMLAFTGTYKNKKITVMGSGMGMPSIGIYSYELYNKFQVQNIIRVGTAGSYTANLNVNDVVLVDSSYSDSTYAKVQGGYDKDIVYPSEALDNRLEEAACRLNIPITKSRVYSTDVYARQPEVNNMEIVVKDKQCMCVEMESFALFHNANIAKKNAACLLTISDSVVTKEKTTAEQREKSFVNMIKIALESI